MVCPRHRQPRAGDPQSRQRVRVWPPHLADMRISRRVILRNSAQPKPLVPVILHEPDLECGGRRAAGDRSGPWDPYLLAINHCCANAESRCRGTALYSLIEPSPISHEHTTTCTYGTGYWHHRWILLNLAVQYSPQSPHKHNGSDIITLLRPLLQRFNRLPETGDLRYSVAEYFSVSRRPL